MTTDQAMAVYAAEDLWEHRDWNASIRFGDWNEVWPFYYDLTERCREAGFADVAVPQVKARKNALKAHYDSATATVFIPPYSKGGVWALTTATAIHEFAHHLAMKSGHGPEFRRVMVGLLDVLGWNSELLAECYAEVGLTMSDKADGITDKVNKLLTHADKAATDEERRTYLEKAEGLASTHSINLALLRKKQADAEDDGERDRPMTGELFSLQSLPSVTYRNLAVELGSSIAYAHGAYCTIRGKSQYITFYGYSEDVHLTELMLTRITPMMFEEADRFLKSEEHRQSGVGSVSARITFCKNFAGEVGVRLSQAVRETEKQVAETLALGDVSVSTEIALREKAVEVRDYVNYVFKRQGVKGSWTGSRASGSNDTAASAGRAAGKSANLYGHTELT